MQNINRQISRIARLLLTAAVVFSALPAAQAQGSAEQGKELGYTCLGCHGIDGMRNAYPSFRVPKLGGQKPEYLETALRAYRDGTRPHPTMRAQAGSLSDDDIDNLVAWLSDNAATDGEPADDVATAEMVAGNDAATICVTCHGVDGAAVQPRPPTLAGQHKSYLEYSMQQYKDGSRGGNVMTAFASTLSDEDIAVLADFYSRQDGLETLQ